MTNQENPIIALWSAPRSRSTCFLRMMVERGDFAVLSEPFCEFFTTGRYQHPPTGHVFQVLSDLSQHIIAQSRSRPVFFKDTTEVPLDRISTQHELLRRTKHAVILRDLKEVILSHYDVEPSMQPDEVGFQNLLELVEIVRSLPSHHLHFVDSNTLAEDPHAEVQLFCDWAGISFNAAALNWSKGHIPIWTHSKKYHEDVSETSGFVMTRRCDMSAFETNGFLADCYEQQKDHYQKLVQIRDETSRSHRPGEADCR